MGLVLSAVAALQFYLIVDKLPPSTFYSGDCGTKLLQAQSLVMQHWRSASVVYPGREIDRQLQFVDTGMLQVRKGRVWGVHSLVFAVPASVTYAWFGYKGLYVVPAVCLLAALFILWLLAKSMWSGWRALFALTLAAFGSPLLFYGLEYWEHTLAVVLVMAAVLLLSDVEGVTRRSWRLVGAGALLVGAATVRPEAAVFWIAAASGLLAVVRPGRTLLRSLGLLTVGSAVVAAPAAIINQELFGDPLGTVLGLHVHRGHPDPRLMIIGKLLMPLTVSAFLELGCAVLGALLLWWLAAREVKQQRSRLTVALGLLAVTVTAAIAAVEIHRLLGLWRQPAEVTSLAESLPVVWALPMAAVAWRFDAEATDRRRARFLAVTAAVYVVGVLATSPTWAGAQWGPRLLLLAIPLLALFLGRLGNARLPSGRVALVAVCTLSLVSAGVQASGLRWLAEVKGLYVNTVRFFERETARGDVLASDQFWFHEVLASLYYQRRFFYVSSPDRMTDFVDRLRASRVPYFYYLLPRGVGYPADTPEKLGRDLLKQAKAQNLLDRGLSLENCVVITDKPYYLIRLGTGGAARSP
jgi:hypothetical protein